MSFGKCDRAARKFRRFVDFGSPAIKYVPVGLERSRPAAPRHLAQALRPLVGPVAFGDASDLQKSGSGGGIGGSQCRRSHVGKASLQPGSKQQTPGKASRPSAALSAHRSNLRENRRFAPCGGILSRRAIDNRPVSCHTQPSVVSTPRGDETCPATAKQLLPFPSSRILDDVVARYGCGRSK
jgi:hypothetical protein